MKTTEQKTALITFADPEYSIPGNYYRAGESGEIVTGNSDASKVQIHLLHPDRFVWVPRGNVEIHTA